MGRLRCDNCKKPTVSKNFHNGQDIKQPFKMERIERYPAISFVDDNISRQTYANTIEEITLV